MSPTPKILDYAIVGDGRSAALVSRNGSIDWLCWPRFDSPSLFAAILDQEVGGAWSIVPTQPSSSERRYLDDTNVLETRFRCETGVVRLTDFMPAMSEGEKRTMLLPEYELLRRVEVEQGQVEMQVRFDPRPNYGRAKITIHDARKFGLRIEIGSNLITLISDVGLEPSPEGGMAARITLLAGESINFSLTFARDGPAVLPPLGELVLRKLALTTEWWSRWSNEATYSGPYRDQVVRSAWRSS